MADDPRSRKLRSEIETYLGTQWKSHLKEVHIFTALSNVQREITMEALCVQERFDLELEAGQYSYFAQENIHRVLDVEAPESWHYPVEPLEPKDWRHQSLCEGNPRFITIDSGLFLLKPVPSSAAILTLTLALKPSPDGSDDVTAVDEPIVSGDFDEILIEGAAARLIPRIPAEARAGLIDAESLLVIYRGKLEAMKRHTKKVQNKTPERMRGESWFPSG